MEQAVVRSLNGASCNSSRMPGIPPSHPSRLIRSYPVRDISKSPIPAVFLVRYGWTIPPKVIFGSLVTIWPARRIKPVINYESFSFLPPLPGGGRTPIIFSIRFPRRPVHHRRTIIRAVFPPGSILEPAVPTQPPFRPIPTSFPRTSSLFGFVVSIILGQRFPGCVLPPRPAHLKSSPPPRLLSNSTRRHPS